MKFEISPASRRTVKGLQADSRAKKQSWMVAGDEMPVARVPVSN